jgi:anti-anti-sigma factor
VGTVVRVEGDVDISTAPALRSLLAHAGPEAAVLVDLSRVTFMDCSGLSALLQARAHHGGRLALRAPPPSLRRILAALDLESAFTIWNTEDLAVAEAIHERTRSPAPVPR